jgi:hypothetical protein
MARSPRFARRLRGTSPPSSRSTRGGSQLTAQAQVVGSPRCPGLLHWSRPLSLPQPVFVPRTGVTRVSDTLDHFPDPLFPFEDPASDPVLPDPTSDRPNPTYDGSDLTGREFLDPDLGVGQVVGPSAPLFLSSQTGNLEADPYLSPRWQPTLLYKSVDSKNHRFAVSEVARWVVIHPPHPRHTFSRQPRFASRRHYQPCCRTLLHLSPSHHRLRLASRRRHHLYRRPPHRLSLPPCMSSRDDGAHACLPLPVSLRLPFPLSTGTRLAPTW